MEKLAIVSMGAFLISGFFWIFIVGFFAIFYDLIANYFISKKCKNKAHKKYKVLVAKYNRLWIFWILGLYLLVYLFVFLWLWVNV